MNPNDEHLKGTVAGPSGDLGLMLNLLTHAATEQASSPVSRIRPHLLQEVDDRQFQYAIDAGVAPLLYRAIRDRIDQVPAARRDALLSADLSAQVRHANVIHTANEIIDTCAELGVRVTLLKGISISDQYYPVAHLRPMGDIDILVPQHAQQSVESAIVRRGYSPMPNYQLDGDSHHGVPLFHPERRVWVEVHSGLFPESADLRRNEAFGPAHVADQSVASTFQGRPVNRLTDELQLVYIASSWIRDLSRNASHPSLALPLLDAVYLLKAARRTLTWNSLLDWLDNEMAIASLYLTLTYLSRRGLDQFGPQILSRLASSQNIIGSMELRIIHTMIDKYLMGGRPFTRLFHSARVWNTLLAPGSPAAKLLLLPWNILFPPHSPDRYTPRYQLERIPRLLRRLR